MKIGVVLFPGSNCDHDVIHLFSRVLKQTVNVIWHQDRDLQNPDIVILPGGFSFGDYLRTGALAKLSPVMEEVVAFAKRGGPVIGICNGFQILCEVGLLPGVLLQNIERNFLSRFVNLRIENSRTPITKGLERGTLIHCPIAHGEGNFFAFPEELAKLEDQGQVVFRYSGADGQIEHDNREFNPNGSVNSIAGVCNEHRNVIGFMPHPERASEKRVGHVGGDSGLRVFTSLLN